MKKIKIMLFVLFVLCTNIFAQYKLGYNDKIKINLFGEPDFSREVFVRPDGNVKLPLIGNVKAVNLSVSQLENKITKLLAKDYYVNPQVTINVLEYNSNKVIILGKINKSGEFKFKEKTTLLKLISLAGGITDDSIKKAIIIRTEKKINLEDTSLIFNYILKNNKSDSQTNNSKIITVDLQNLFNNNKFNNDVVLQNNDIVYIPSSELFFVFGEVKKPGSYKFEDNLTVLKAITLSGGFTSAAKKKDITIIRNEKKIKVSLETKILPQDVIIIPESWF